MAWGGNGTAWGERAAFWRGHIVAQGASGLSIRGYCREHGLTEGVFYQWRRRLRRDEAASSKGSPGKSPVTFAEVRLAPRDREAAALGSGVEVVLAGERRLCLDAGFDAETLRRAVSVLESLSC